MGFFSWKTSDSSRSIANECSIRETFKVHLVTKCGKVFTETSYGGYGVFGGVDFYALMTYLNDKSVPAPTEEGNVEWSDEFRSKGITLAFGNESFESPKLVENLPSFEKGSDKWAMWFNDLPNSEMCDEQGYFYGE